MLSRDARTLNVRYAHMEGPSISQPQYIRVFLKTSRLMRLANWQTLWITFAFYSPILVFMFPGPESSKRVVVQCKGCGENIPAPVETMPSQPIAARCPLCHEHRRYLPSEVFLGRLSHLMIRKPVTTADGRVGR
jgi:hypothetical protein